MAKHGEPTVQDNLTTIHSYVCPFPNFGGGLFYFSGINFNLRSDKI